MLWTEEVEMVDSVDDLKSSCSIQGNTQFPKLRVARREDCVCFEQDHPEFPTWEEGQSRGTESSKTRSIPSRKTDRLHDLRLLPGYWRSWHRSWSCWLIYSCSSKRWHSGIRYEMGRIFTIEHKISTRWHLGMFVQIENMRVWSTRNRIGIVRHGDSSKDKRCPIIRNWRHWWKGEKIRTYDYETLTPSTGELKQEHRSRIERD